MKRNPWLFVPVLVAVVGAVLGATSVANAASVAYPTKAPKHYTTTLAGTWSGKYSGAFTGTFTLHWTQTGTALEWIDHAVETEWKVQCQRQCARHRYQLRGRWCWRNLYGVGLGDVDVRQLQEPCRRRELERSKDLTDRRSLGLPQLAHGQLPVEQAWRPPDWADRGGDPGRVAGERKVRQTTGGTSKPCSIAC